jgi:dTDP-4-dehydrorhamnose 3,5-epimerase
LDVAVDLRFGEPSFGHWVAIELSEDNFKQLFIPAGFAHGFASLSDTSDVQYKSSAYYAPSAERTIRWDDQGLAIEWGVSEPIVSAKDQAGMSLAEYRSNPAYRSSRRS